MGKKEHAFRARWIADAVWPATLALMIFLASDQSQVATPVTFAYMDKVAHFLVFGLLGTLTVRVVYRSERPLRSAVYATLIVSAYGVVDEFHQSFTPGRSVEVADWVADTSGAMLASCLYVNWTAWRQFLEWAPGRTPSEGAGAARNLTQTGARATAVDSTEL